MKASTATNRLAPILVLSGVLLIGGSGRAVLGGYYQVSGTMDRWLDITDAQNGTNATLLYQPPISISEWTQTITLPFPEQFPFNGNRYGILEVASNGFASFGGMEAGFAKLGLPTTTLAPWWGAMGVCSSDASVSWGTRGAEPDLTVIVQWKNVTYDPVSGAGECDGAYGKDTFSFQLLLHEDGRIGFLYGPYILDTAGFVDCHATAYFSGFDWCPAGTFPPDSLDPLHTGHCLFAAGLEDDSGSTYQGMAGLQCGASCIHNEVPVNGTLGSFTNGPDLQIEHVNIDSAGQLSPGQPLTVTVQVTNAAPNPLASPSNGSEGVNFYLSSDGRIYDPSSLLNATPVSLGVPGLAPGDSRSVSLAVPLPTNAPVNQLLGIVAVLDEPATSNDTDPAGKSMGSDLEYVIPPRPDLVAETLSSPSTGAPGGTLILVPTIANQGNADSVRGTPYAYYLVPRGALVVTPTDLELGSPLTLPAIPLGEQMPVQQDSVHLPPWLPAGDYQVGMLIDPAGTALDLNTLNNAALSPTILNVSDHGLTVTSTALPYGYVGGGYQAVLTAAHGLAPYTWSVAPPANGAGPLPSGLELDSGGQITGTPDSAITATVAFQVRDSSSPPESTTAPLVIKIVATELPLTVITDQLPTGGFNQEYLVELSAIGGQWPYHWSLVANAGKLPPGMTLGEEGTLSGLPAQSGAFSFQVQVTDSAPNPAVVSSPQYDLDISAPGTITLATNQLPNGVVGEAYQGVLRALGGSGRYSWTLLGDLELPSGPGAVETNWNAVEPPGFNKLDPDGSLTGNPRHAGLFAMSVQATEILFDGGPGSSATDTVLLQIFPTNGLYLRNTSLPIATVNVPYRVKLDTNADSSKGSVIFQPVDGDGLDSPAARDSLPAGLELSLDGTIQGTASTAGEYLFLVQASDDAQNRSTITALFLKVQDKWISAPGGCTTGSGPSLWLAALLVLGLSKGLRRPE